jgi:hypothetical protein
MKMLLKIRSHDDRFPDFCDKLAWNLGDQGKIYTPYPLIPPNARMAIPTPTEIVVALTSIDAFTIVHQTMEDYLKHHEEGKLVIEKEDKTDSVTGRRIPKLDALINKLLMNS